MPLIIQVIHLSNMKKRLLAQLKAEIEFLKSQGTTAMIPTYKMWCKQVISGKAQSPSFRTYLESQIVYYRPTDCPYAKFLSSLL